MPARKMRRLPGPYWSSVWLLALALTPIGGFETRLLLQEPLPSRTSSSSWLSFATSRRVPPLLPRVLFSTPNYGRGAEIWPPTNEESIRLEDSFPGRKIPDDAQQLLKEYANTAPDSKDQIRKADKDVKLLEWGQKWFLLGGTTSPRSLVRRILRRAASAQERGLDQSTSSAQAETMDKTPAIVAIALLLTGHIRPVDAVLVAFLSWYFVTLASVAKSVRKPLHEDVDNNVVVPIMPALPPQGHVPSLVSNPLGYDFSYSIPYDRWLRLGVLVGLLAPLGTSLRYAFVTHNVAATSLVLRPLFFLCCQAISEAIGRRVMTPLPLRILVPISYNTVRLWYLWQWTFAAQGILGWWGRGLAVMNLLYWSANLFAFLLPIAAVRYARAHFMCVEFEQVTTRSGMEESVGLQS